MDIIEEILELPKQCEQAWDEARKVKFTAKYTFDNIVVAGMGGSALGAHIVRSVMKPNVPFIIVNDYKLPEFVNNKSLIILSSYSGNTEEVLSCAEEAKEKGSLITGLTTGGKLGEWLTSNNYPSYIFEPRFNQSGQPRMGVGYGIFGILGLLTAMGFYHETLDIEIKDEFYDVSWDKAHHEAKKYLRKTKDKIFFILAAEHLVGNAHAFANQVNETAKTLSSWFTLPEANHHLFEGLKHPKSDIIVVFLTSELYEDRIKKRIEVTKELFIKEGIEFISYHATNMPNIPGADFTIAEALETLMFSSLLTAYLGLEYQEDPLANPTVDYFKERLG